jgi:hypothetical protein
MGFVNKSIIMKIGGLDGQGGGIGSAVIKITGGMIKQLLLVTHELEGGTL